MSKRFIIETMTGISVHDWDNNNKILKGVNKMTCETCEGVGFISHTEDEEIVWNPCPYCLIWDKCPECGQDGVIDWEHEPIACVNPECDWKDQ